MNWVENLPNYTHYMLVLNEKALEEPAKKSPFEFTEENQTWLQKLHIRMIKQSFGCQFRMNPQVLKM